MAFDLATFSRDDLQKSLPNRDLLYVSFENDIPPVQRGLYISVSFDKHGNIQIDNSSKQIPDPSTIYIHLPISDGIAEPLPYWPHYIEMSPQQRYKYLCWLRNVEEPIDMGYVFIYYYGLERQMLSGNFDRAFDEIIKLRNVHKNRSFQKYSENALVHAALMTGRVDRLIDLHQKTEISGYSNAMFLLAYNEKMTLGETHLMLIFRKLFTLSKNADKENRSLYKQCIAESLVGKYPNGFPIINYDISKIAVSTETRFANYSFPPEIQQAEITDFYKCKPLMADLESLFKDSYALYKEKKKLLKSGKTVEEIVLALRDKNKKRYKKLLKEKLITESEFNLLSEALNNY